MLHRMGIGIAGFGVLILGLALLVVPVPGTTFIVLPLGLTILAKEFVWASRLLTGSKNLVRRVWLWVRVAPQPA